MYQTKPLTEKPLPASIDKNLLQKPRALLVSAVVPMERSGGGCLALYRHFILNQDFNIAVATARPYSEKGIPFHHIKLDRFSERVQRTRFSKLTTNVAYIRNWVSLPKPLIQFAEKFDPDIIFSVVDDWHMGLAWQLSKHLNKPLAVNFQDLFAVSQFQPSVMRPYPGILKFLINKYHFLNSKADIVFHTSEGMKAWFGDKSRGDVLYPIGSAHTVPSTISVNTSNQKPLQIIYAGNCNGAYGRMILELANATIGVPEIQLKIYTSADCWSEKERHRLLEAGIYQGFRPFDQLQHELSAADAFLTVMSFETTERTFMETSFTTKWLDYAPLGKPVFVWAPNYSTAHQFALRHQAGKVVNSNDPLSVINAILESSANPTHWESLSRGAIAAAEGPLNPHTIHDLLKSRLIDIISRESHTF